MNLDFYEDFFWPVVTMFIGILMLPHPTGLLTGEYW